MKWVAGVYSDVLYMVEKRPLDPRWSQEDLMALLAWCAKGQGFGWSEDRAFLAAEALIMRTKNHGISWSHTQLNEDLIHLSETT